MLGRRLPRDSGPLSYLREMSTLDHMTSLRRRERLATTPATAPSTAAAAAAAAPETAPAKAPAVAAGRARLGRTLVADVARLRLAIERAARFARQLIAGAGLATIAAARQLVVGTPTLAAVPAADVRPAVAAAVVFLPVAAIVAAIDLAVAAGVHVVARSLGDGGVADLLALPAVGGQLAGLRPVAPAVVAVIDVDVGAVVDVHATTAAVAARPVPAAARHREAPEEAD